MPTSQGNVVINKPIPMHAQITWIRKSLGIWNEHFAHANNGMILQMFKNNAIFCMQLATKKQELKVCEGCAFGKDHNHPFPTHTLVL
jgi:hypothetical protein